MFHHKMWVLKDKRESAQGINMLRYKKRFGKGFIKSKIMFIYLFIYLEGLGFSILLAKYRQLFSTKTIVGNIIIKQ